MGRAHAASRTSDRDVAGGGVALGHVDLELLAPADAGLAPTPGHHGRVGGHASSGREDALRGVHAAHVIRDRLDSQQDDVPPLLGRCLRILCCEHRLPHRRPRGRREAPSDDILGIRLGVLELRESKAGVWSS